jgi:hypothetical protein
LMGMRKVMVEIWMIHTRRERRYGTIDPTVRHRERVNGKIRGGGLRDETLREKILIVRGWREIVWA